LLGILAAVFIQRQIAYELLLLERQRHTLLLLIGYHLLLYLFIGQTLSWVLCHRVIYKFCHGFLHTLMCLGFGVKLCSRLGISVVCQHRWPLSCDIILEALYFIDSFLGVLCISSNAMLLYHFWIDVDVLSSCVHAGSWLC
jgi:hypothetical protein